MKTGYLKISGFPALLISMCCMASVLLPLEKHEDVKADLLVRSVKIFKTGETGEGPHLIKIIVTIENRCPIIKCVGPFVLSAESEDPPSHTRTRLGSARVASLCSKPKSTTQRFFSDTLAKGKTRLYTFIVDSGSQVEESDEMNNSRMARYTAD